jgi:hypothetical protein
VFRAAHYLARSGLPPVPETARYLVLKGAGIESTTGVSFVDTRDNVQRWLAASMTAEGLESSSRTKAISRA